MKLDKLFFDVIRREGEALRGFGVRRIGIFGSAARGEDTEKSDVDVLVEFDRKTFDNYMGVKLLLEERFGRRVDLVVMDALKPALKDDVLREVRYAA